MFQKIIRAIAGDPNKREILRLAETVDQINALEKTFEALTDEQLKAKTTEFCARLAEGETLDDLLVEAFAAVREASKRTIGLRHFDVQMMGGMVLHQGKIAEMRTGEGKTLVATLPVYLNALTGKGVHLITVNDYLARRDARWMAPIYKALGLTVGVLQMASRTENGKKAFLVDLEKTSPFEDQHQLVMVDRAEAYRADVTYGTNSEFGFDYLRDNLTSRLSDRSQRGHYFAIVDEVDNILIDEARTPLIISGPAADEAEWYVRMAQVVRALKEEDYEINERDRTVTLTEVGEAHVEELLDMALGDPDRPEDISPEQARVLGYLEQALKAQFLFKRNKDYIVQAGKVVIVDEFTGRLMPGRRWSEGLHQAVEAKEGVRVEAENITYATITIQNYFRMYEKLAGMTGTALTESEEFHKIYKLEVLPITTNLEYNALREGGSLVEINSKDELGYKQTYYASKVDPLKQPAYWRRKDYPDVIYRSEEAKIRAITEEILRYHVLGRPQLVGTTSVEHSERLSQRLQPELLRRLTQTMLVRQYWLDKNNRQMTETAIPELQFLNKSLPELNVGELRNFARPLGMSSMNPEDPANLSILARLFNLTEGDLPRLSKVLQGGITHQVLNARKHDEESKIIAKAGAFGAVTIATNMAGRGVDIKLGGELDEDILRDVIRVMRRVGVDPYNMTNEQRLQVLQQVSPDQYGIYTDSIKAFLQYMDEMRRVRELGGLHVIGSERHEARRIDNQLRGRSSRQGDPGSSRFYLSLEDDLMRLFGGAQVENLLKRLNIDESMPLENNLVARIVEQSQTRVEGSNFDVRKHLLEYDDVLNMQRKRIYAQRDRVFTKEDLTEDVETMLQETIRSRVPGALNDEEGPWKLLAYLDEIQPTIQVEGLAYPSFTIRLILEELRKTLPEKQMSFAVLQEKLVDIARRALEGERDHIVRTTEAMLDRTEDALDQQRNERMETIDTFFEGLDDRVGGEGGPVRPQELLDELSALVRTSLRLSPDQLRRLPDGDEDVADAVRQQVTQAVASIQVARLIGSMERRVEDWTLKASQLQGLEWADIADAVMQEVENAFVRRIDRHVGENGQINRDLEALFEKAEGGQINENGLISLLLMMMEGSKLTFDRKTHKRGRQRVIRFTYVFLAAKLLDGKEANELIDDVLEHLHGAQTALRILWGRFEFGRLFQTGSTLGQLDGRLKEGLADELGAERLEELSATPLAEIPGEDQRKIIDVLGTRLQNEIYREVLLSVISQLWVDYLTRVDALRVSIGLEAYAQRDPLVQYKSKASEMFSALLVDIRGGVVSRMFTYRPSRSASASVERERGEGGAAATSAKSDANVDVQRKKKKKH